MSAIFNIKQGLSRRTNMEWKSHADLGFNLTALCHDHEVHIDSDV